MIENSDPIACPKSIPLQNRETVRMRARATFLVEPSFGLDAKLDRGLAQHQFKYISQSSTTERHSVASVQAHLHLHHVLFSMCKVLVASAIIPGGRNLA